MSIVSVPLSEKRAYKINIGEAGFTHGGKWTGEEIRSLARSPRAVIITQSNIAQKWAVPLQSSLQAAGFESVPVMTFAAGERYKTLATVQKLCGALYELDPPVDRKTLIVALGGGVVGDVAGFVAGIYLRGLDYVQIPTTLLAMVDSSVGGKTGVDFRAGKNLVGAFHQPRGVIIDTATLSTLPMREMQAGMAEVIKYGLICDPELLHEAAQSVKYGNVRLNPDIRNDIRRSCEIKAQFVAQDEFEETGLRAILNYGHTIGHAIEAATQYRRFRHGEAVAMGMMAAAFIGESHGVTPPHIAEVTRAALLNHKLPTAIPADITPNSLLSLLGRDKKAEAGRPKWILARNIGDVAVFGDVSEGAVRAGLLRAYEGLP